MQSTDPGEQSLSSGIYSLTCTEDGKNDCPENYGSTEVGHWTQKGPEILLGCEVYELNVKERTRNEAG
jgi:hypothetical protein